MKNWAFLILIIASCNKKTVVTNVQNNYTKFKVTQLIADNLSEDISGNDEIEILIYALKDSIPVAQITKEWTDSIIFEKEKERSKSIDFEFSINQFPSNNAQLIFLILESDTTTSIAENSKKIKTVLEKANYKNHDSLEIQINRSIHSDDLLGISFHKLSDLYRTGSGTVVFSGINIFDKYYYRLLYKLE
jgi:hypothetical protein